jgi:hypothetical protein
MGAFLVVPLETNPAAGWRRFGINVSGDTSRRQLYLPAAGKYGISVADTRSLFLDASSPPGAGNGAAAGHPQATYFLSIAVLPEPVPTALTAAGGVATTAGTLVPGEVKLFTAPMGPGDNEVELAIPTTPRAAIAVTRNGVYRADGAETQQPALVTVDGFSPGEVAVVAADTVYHYGPGGAAYTLIVRQL